MVGSKVLHGVLKLRRGLVTLLVPLFLQVVQPMNPAEEEERLRMLCVFTVTVAYWSPNLPFPYGASSTELGD